MDEKKKVDAKVGDRVVCRYYNRETNEYFGEFFNGNVEEVCKVEKFTDPAYLVRRDDKRLVELWEGEVVALYPVGASSLERFVFIQLLHGVEPIHEIPYVWAAIAKFGGAK